MLKSLLIITTLTLSMTAYAEPDIATAKSEMTANLDKRIAALQEAKTCVSSAGTPEDLKKCHQSLKEDRMEMRKDRLEKKESRLKDRLQKIEDQKAETK